MANRMGLDGTMLHYLAVQKAIVSVHRLVHSKITLTYSLTWQTCSPRRMALKALLNAKAARPFLGFAQVVLIVRNNCQNGLLLKHMQLRVLSIYIDRLKLNYTCVGILTIRLCSIKSSLPFSLPLRHSRDKLYQALSRFSVLQVTESWAGPGNEARVRACNSNRSL